MRTEYELSEAQLNNLLESCKPVPYMVFGDMAPRSPQENANAAWKSLGGQMGFDHMTVRPVPGKSDLFFTATAREVAS